MHGIGKSTAGDGYVQRWSLEDQNEAERKVFAISFTEFKQHLLKPLIHKLNAQFEATVLQKVNNEGISLKELKEESTSSMSVR